MYPSSTASAVVRTSIMGRALALVVIASILMATTMLAVTPSPVGATEPEPADNCGVVPIDLVFILDRSGSMATSEGGQTRLAWAKQAATGLVTALDTSTGATGDVGTLHRVGATRFGNGAANDVVTLASASNAATVNAGINGLTSNGGTPFDLGMNTGAANMLAGDRTTHLGVTVKQVLVFLSDGNPDPDSTTPDAGEIASYLAAADVAYAVAIGADGGDLGGGGTGVDHDLMKLIANPSPANFRFVTEASGLPNLFSEIYEEIACPSGLLEVAKSLSPTTDPGKFNLFIQGITQANDRVHGGTTGEQPIDPGAFTVGESAGTGTSLGNYTAGIACVDQANGGAAVGTTGTGPAWSVTVADGADVLCTITNTRNTGKIELVKNLTPDNDPGRFDLWIGGTMLKDEAGEGGTTGERVVNTGAVALAETAGDNTDLADYDASIECEDEAEEAPVPTSGTAPNWSVNVTHNSDIVCTITNTRGTGKLEVRKALDPTTDLGDFNLLIDNAVAGTGGNVGHGGTTGEQTVSTGNHTVGESASGDTDLADYASSVSCWNGDAQVGVTGSAPSWTVDVTKGADIVCTITNSRRTGTIEVIKRLDPKLDPGKFDLLIDGTSHKDDATDEDTTGAVEVNTGTHTVGEAGGAFTNLDDYSSSIVCLNGQSPVTATKGDGATWSVNVTDGAAVVCTITNERETGELTVIKHLDPTDDPGVFDLRIDGAVEEANASHGDGTGAVTVNTGTHTVGETAGTDTTLADYDSSVSCWDGDSEVTATPAAGTSWSVNVTDGADVVCTITNTRDTGWLTVEKDLDPGDDPGRFDLLINGVSELTHAGDGASTGEVEVNTGVNTVGESAEDGTSLGNYSSSIECIDGGGEGEIIASGLGAGPLEVTVTDGEYVVCTITNQRVTVGFEKDLPEGHDGTVEPGDTITYTLTVHVNDGDATGVVVTDTLPIGLTYVEDSAVPSEGFSDDGQDLEWIIGNLAEGTYEFTYDATVDANASGDLENLGCVDADQNHDFPIFDIFGAEEESDLVCEETTVKVQELSIEKTNNAAGSIVAGTAVDFTLTFDVINGPIDDVTIVDQLPGGLGNVTMVSDGGSYSAALNRITWTDLDGIEHGDTLTYRAIVNADASAGAHTNVATITDGPCVGDGCEDGSTVTVRVPSLTVDKTASADTITISGPASAPIATPSVVTWTLTYTLANGPVDNAVISDVVPTGFVFLDATDGGTFAAGSVTWNLGTLSASGSVSFRTTVDPTTISRTAATVNTAVIDSDQTPPDEGTDSVTVSVEPPPLGSTPTPRPSLPNTATATGLDGQALTVPVELLVALFIGSLGALALANVRSRRR